MSNERWPVHGHEELLDCKISPEVVLHPPGWPQLNSMKQSVECNVDHLHRCANAATVRLGHGGVLLPRRGINKTPGWPHWLGI